MAFQNSVDAPTDRTVPAVQSTAPTPTTQQASAAPQLPSVHVRAVITWLAIFPLVAVGMMALGPLMDAWHPVLRSLMLTAIVVPLAVYLVVPRMFAAYGKLMKRRALKAAERASSDSPGGPPSERELHRVRTF